MSGPSRRDAGTVECRDDVYHGLFARQLNGQLAGELSTIVKLTWISVPVPAVSLGLAASAVFAPLGTGEGQSVIHPYSSYSKGRLDSITPPGDNDESR